MAHVSQEEDEDILDERDGFIVMRVNDWIPNYLPPEFDDLQRWDVYQTCHCSSSSNDIKDKEASENNISIVEACCMVVSSKSKEMLKKKILDDERAFLHDDDDDKDNENDSELEDNDIKVDFGIEIDKSVMLRFVLEFNDKEMEKNENYIPTCHAIYQNKGENEINSKWDQIYIKTVRLNGKFVESPIIDESIDLICKSDELNESESMDLSLLLNPLSKKQLIMCIVNYLKTLEQTKFKQILKQLVVAQDGNKNKASGSNSNDNGSGNTQTVSGFAINIFNFLTQNDVATQDVTKLHQIISKHLLLQCDNGYIKKHPKFQTFTKEDFEMFCMKIVCLDDSIIDQFEQYMESDLSEMCNEFELALKMGILENICDEFMQIIKTIKSLNEMKKLFIIFENLSNITNKFVNHLCLICNDYQSPNSNKNKSNDENKENNDDCQEYESTLEYYDQNELMSNGKLNFLMQNLESVWENIINKIHNVKSLESNDDKLKRFNHINMKMKQWKTKLTSILGPIFSDNIRNLNVIAKNLNNKKLGHIQKDTEKEKEKETEKEHEKEKQKNTSQQTSSNNKTKIKTNSTMQTKGKGSKQGKKRKNGKGFTNKQNGNGNGSIEQDGQLELPPKKRQRLTTQKKR